MPRRDGSGPMGQGPLTGRGMGNCSGSGRGFFGMGRGRGMGMGFNFGRFFGRGANNSLSKTDELGQLKTQANVLEQDLETVKQRIDEIEKSEGV